MHHCTLHVFAIAALLTACSRALKLSNGSYSAQSSQGLADVWVNASFVEYYNAVKSGRGIWKWNNALIAYDRHMSKFKGQSVEGAEVGVQSGGSLLMWSAVLGKNCKIHGLDINPACARFAGPQSSITIGDQGDVAMWSDFFTTVAPELDFLIDDGGHFASQMLQTTYQAWPRLRQGGLLAIEDIHGPSYLQSFFIPVAQFLAGQTDLASVHLYSYLMLMQKSGGIGSPYDPSSQAYDATSRPAGTQTVHDMAVLDSAIASAAAGSLILVPSPTGHLLTLESLKYFFWKFNGLHVPTAIASRPKDCEKPSNPKSQWNGCVYFTSNSAMQSRVFAVHIFPNRLIIEVQPRPPSIEAIKRGDQWVSSATMEEFRNFMASHDNKHAVHFVDDQATQGL